MSYKSNPHGSVTNLSSGQIRQCSATGPRASVRPFPKPPTQDQEGGSGLAPFLLSIQSSSFRESTLSPQDALKQGVSLPNSAGALGRGICLCSETRQAEVGNLHQPSATRSLPAAPARPHCFSQPHAWDSSTIHPPDTSVTPWKECSSSRLLRSELPNGRLLHVLSQHSAYGMSSRSRIPSPCPRGPKS